MTSNQQAPEDGSPGLKRTIDIDDNMIAMRASPSESSYLHTP